MHEKHIICQEVRQPGFYLIGFIWNCSFTNKCQEEKKKKKCIQKHKITSFCSERSGLQIISFKYLAKGRNSQVCSYHFVMLISSCILFNLSSFQRKRSVHERVLSRPCGGPCVGQKMSVLWYLSTEESLPIQELVISLQLLL